MIAFVLSSVCISGTDGSRWDTVIMDERLAVKLEVTMRIANNQGASTARAKLLFTGSPTYKKYSRVTNRIGSSYDLVTTKVNNFRLYDNS